MAEETDGGGGESMEAARVESDNRNENAAKDRVDSPEQVAGDLEREREREAEQRGAGGELASPWRLVLMLGRGSGFGEVQRQTSGCMRQVHTSSRPRAIQRLSTIQTPAVSLVCFHFPLTLPPLAITPCSSPPLALSPLTQELG